MNIRHQHPLGMKARSEIDLLIRGGGGLISRRDHPSLANTMAWLVRQGKLVPVLPGIYAAPEIARGLEVRMRAVSLRHPDAVVLGAAAARASFWPGAPIRAIVRASESRADDRRNDERTRFMFAKSDDDVGFRAMREQQGQKFLAGIALHLADAPRTL